MLSAWVDGELNPAQAQRVEVHLEQCPACNREVEALLDCCNLLGGVEELPMPVGLQESIRRAISTEATAAGCSPVRSLLSPFLDGELGAPDRERVAAHLDSCAACTEHLAGMRRTVRVVNSLPAAEPPQGLSARILARTSRRAPRTPVFATAAAGLLAAAGLALFLAPDHPSAVDAGHRARSVAIAPIHPGLEARGSGASVKPQSASAGLPGSARANTEVPPASSSGANASGLPAQAGQPTIPGGVMQPSNSAPTAGSRASLPAAAPGLAPAERSVTGLTEPMDARDIVSSAPEAPHASAVEGSRPIFREGIPSASRPLPVVDGAPEPDAHHRSHAPGHSSTSPAARGTTAPIESSPESSVYGGGSGTITLARLSAPALGHFAPQHAQAPGDAEVDSTNRLVRDYVRETRALGSRANGADRSLNGYPVLKATAARGAVHW